MKEDVVFQTQYKEETVRAIYEHQEEEYRHLRDAMENRF